MDTNILYDLMFKLESQLKQTESEIKIKNTIALSEIETMLVSATSVSEIIKFEKQYEATEKKYEQEILKQKRKIIREYLAALEKLVKHFKKQYSQELKSNNFEKDHPRCKKLETAIITLTK